MQSNNSVKIEKYAEGHFIKTFSKKYKSHWDVTLEAITFELGRIDYFFKLKTKKLEDICGNDSIRIIKLEFTVAKSNQSAHASGNRCIAVWDKKKNLVSILLVYGKTDLSGHNETAEWKGIIRDNYPEYSHLF